MLKKTFLILFFLFCLFFLNNNSVLALELTYPPLPGIEITPESTLPQYIIYFFTFSTIIAGAIALIALAVASVRLIMSAGDPTGRGDAIDAIKSAILGLVLTVSAFIIMNTINPAFIAPHLESLPPVPGVFYSNDDPSKEKPVPQEVSDVTDAIQTFFKIIYRCPVDSTGKFVGSPLLMWQFTQKNFEHRSDYLDANTVRILCGGEILFGGFSSFKIALETPGVYYTLMPHCKGFMSNANTKGGEIPIAFAGRVKSVKIVNDPPQGYFYGAILHNRKDLTDGSGCTIPFFEKDLRSPGGCYDDFSVLDPTFAAYSADIFIWNAVNSKTSGDGVDFYSEPFGWNTGAKAGISKVTQDHIITGDLRDLYPKTDNYWSAKAENLIFNYTNVDVLQDYKNTYKTFRQRPGSIKIKGEYYVTLYTKLSQYKYFCQTFWQDVSNAGEIEFVEAGNKIDAIEIIPISY